MSLRGAFIKYDISRQILAKSLPDQHHRVHFFEIHRQPLSWLLNIFKVKKTDQILSYSEASIPNRNVGFS